MGAEQKQRLHTGSPDNVVKGCVRKTGDGCPVPVMGALYPRYSGGGAGGEDGSIGREAEKLRQMRCARLGGKA